ncbi:MAG: endo-1,4-beta-xylanase, partial [Oscillospiraceae bacterium]|nr:endo-1,4-beta-xylanase [Oscillospiraceae bacterium]
MARKHFPNETLVFNEANNICQMAKQDYRNAYYMLLENSILKGASIDKIGIQHHCFTGATAKNAEEYEREVKKGSDMFSPTKILKGLDIAASFGFDISGTYSYRDSP